MIPKLAIALPTSSLNAGAIPSPKIPDPYLATRSFSLMPPISLCISIFAGTVRAAAMYFIGPEADSVTFFRAL